jgi:hypothetical protein
MPRSFSARAVPAALLIALATIACSETATEPTGFESVGLVLQAQTTDGQVAALVVEVTGPGQTDPIVGNFEFDEDGVATGQLTVPVGQRTFTARAYHEQGFVTHEASTTQVVVPGDSHVHLSLVPVAGDVTVEVQIDQGIIIVHPEEVDMVVGDGFQFEATVMSSDDTPHPDPAVMWASSNTSVAEVDGDGVATAYLHGESAIVASHQGLSAAAVVRVRSPFQDFHLELFDEDGQLVDDALGNLTGAMAEPADEDWPLRLTGVVTPCNLEPMEPMETTWPARLEVASNEGAPVLELFLDGAVTPSDLVVAPPSFQVRGGRGGAVDAASEIASELESEQPDMVRVAELTEVLIALMGLPIPNP